MKFDHLTKWNINKQGSVLENKTQKNHWDFEIKTDYLIPARSPDLDITYKKKKKRTGQIVDFANPVGQKGKIKENDKRQRYLDLARELKELWKIKVTVIPIINGVLKTIPKGLVRG